MKNNASGFTLIEVLMVTVLLFFLSYAVFVSMRSTVNLKENLDEKGTGLQSIRAVVGLMERDFQRSFFVTADDLGWNPPEPDPQTPPEDLAPPPSPPLSISVFQGEVNSVFLSTATHQRLSQDAKENEQHFVSYQLNNDSLIRAESLRAVSFSDREDPSKFREIEVLERVEKLEFAYLHPRTLRWENKWDSQSKETLDMLPAAVRVYAEFIPESEKLKEKIGVHTINTAFRLAEDSFRNEAKLPKKRRQRRGQVNP